MDLSNALKRNGDGPTEEEDVGPRPVCLPTAGLSYTNYSAVVTGWGTNAEGGSVSNTLQEVC